jgi:hypothetical protein
MLNIYANNSEPENTTELFDPFSDYTAEEYENITESNNSSETEDIMQRVRTLNIETDSAGPEPESQTDRILSMNCENPKAICVTVRCSLKGPIGNMSKAFIIFNMSADFQALGESSDLSVL